MFDAINADFERYCRMSYGRSDVTLGNRLRIWFCSYGLHALVAHRFYHWSLQKANFPITIGKFALIPIIFIISKIVEQFYDIKISPHATIGPGCYIGHFGGIRIGKCQIGKFCNINHQVKIADYSEENPERQVVVADRVWIGAHSQILLGMTIGNGVAISAGTTVVSNIPDRVLVAGPTSRILKHNFNNSALLGLASTEDFVCLNK